MSTESAVPDITVFVRALRAEVLRTATELSALTVDYRVKAAEAQRVHDTLDAVRRLYNLLGAAILEYDPDWELPAIDSRH